MHKYVGMIMSILVMFLLIQDIAQMVHIDH